MAKALLPRLREASVPQLARFALVGASGVVVNSVMRLLRGSGGLPLAAASALAIETATCATDNEIRLPDGRDAGRRASYTVPI